MKLSEANVCIQIKCISFCSSNFAYSHINQKNCNNVDTEKNKSNGCNEIDDVKLKNLVGNVYIGKVLNVGTQVDNIIKGKNIIGIFSINSKIKNDEIIAPYHDIIEYPYSDINNDYLLCATFRSLYESYICLSVINDTKKLNYIAIFADNILQILPFLKMLLKKKFFILIFLSEKNYFQHIIKKKLEEFDIKNDCIKERVSIFSINMNICEHVNTITNKLGIKYVVVYPNLSIDKDTLKKYIFTVCTINANLIFTYEFDYLNPHECKILFEKGIRIHFFNINNYIYYDYLKRTNALNYVLLSILNKDIDIPTISINQKYFTTIEEILSSNSYDGSYNIHINKNVDYKLDNS